MSDIDISKYEKEIDIVKECVYYLRTLDLVKSDNVKRLFVGLITKDDVPMHMDVKYSE